MTQANPSPSYTNRFVCFIDILGFKDHIQKNTGSSDVLNLILSLKHINYIGKRNILFSPSQIIDGVSFSYFSDCVVLTAEDTLDCLDELMRKACIIVYYLLFFKFFTRGALTFGPVYHDQDFCFGPAFVQAYELERSTAIFPRVILDTEKLYGSSVNVNSWISGFRWWSSQPLQIDPADGHIFIDYLKIAFDSIEAHWSDEEVRADHYHIKKFISDGLQNPNKRIAQKYQWAKERYNAHAIADNRLSQLPI